MEASEAGAEHVRRRRGMESMAAGWQLGCAAREICLRRVFVVVALLQFIHSLWLHSMWNISSQDQGLSTQPPHWKCKVSATGPAGKSCLRFAPTVPSGSVSKESAGDVGWIPGQGDPLEKKMATHSSIHAWKSHGQRSLVGLQSLGSQRVEYDLATEPPPPACQP